MSKSKFWCFTENSNADAFHARLETIYSSHPDHISYICGQLEVASTGQRHFQGYVQLRVSRAMSWLKNNVSSTAHWEIQGKNSSCMQARDYCRKVDETTVNNTFIEFGNFVAGGKASAGSRSDIISLKEAIKSGATQRELIESDEHVETFAKYIKFHDRMRSLYPTKRKEDAPFKVSLYFGEPGSGKTRKANEFEDLFEIPISNGTLWFDGYDGHKVVLFDDFMGGMSKMTLDNTLKFLDRYVRKIPIKGAHVWYQPEHIIVTTNYHPRAWYKWEGREESWKALCRRFHEVLVFHKDEEPEAQDVEEFLNDHDLWPQIILEQ